MLDVARIRQDFPILSRRVHGDVPLVYLDSAATAQKPLSVIEAESNFYLNSNAAIHRGAHALAELATAAFEESRHKIADFIGATPSQVVFNKNATEGLNTIAYGFSNATAKLRAGSKLNPGEERFVLEVGDEIVVTQMEHHANLVPWQEVALKTGAVLRFIEATDDGRLDLTNLDSVINDRTKVVSVVHQSNLLGTINAVDVIIARAKAVGAWAIIDACQSVPHMPVNVVELGADFLVFSGHKMCGPTGIGVLWGTDEALAALPVFMAGGSMIETVHFDRSTYAKAPQKFEAGTQMAAQVVGLAAAVDYLSALGMSEIAAHEHRLTELAVAALSEIKGVRIIGPNNAVNRGSAISFVVDQLHPHDVGQVLDSRGVAVRVGHHCAWPTCRRFNVPATTRASFYLYNDESEIEPLVSGILAAQKFFGVS
ncbi:MAG: hypothetical protein RL441_343 [Actinomycetota bacterium]|jgi:cysteine desulfurase/selenocysteine lyase